MEHKPFNYIDGLVSVITPVYNAEKFIAKTIKSVLNQTYSNIEFLLVNDCSADSSLAIINQFDDKRIIVINNENNMGAAMSRNRAIREAKGRYIAFVDSDDVWEKDKLAKQVKLLQDSKYVMSYTALNIVGENGNHYKYQDVPKIMTYKKLLRNTAIATSSTVIDRKKVEITLEMPNRRTGEDYSLWLSILKKCGSAIGCQEYLVRYRKVANSLSRNRSDSFGDLWYGQHIQNGISIPCFLFNYACFAVNAVKKHYF